MTTLVGRSLTYNRPDLVHGALVAAGPIAMLRWSRLRAIGSPNSR